jgi:hypothetical protein
VNTCFLCEGALEAGDEVTIHTFYASGDEGEALYERRPAHEVCFAERCSVRHERYRLTGMMLPEDE